MMKVQKNTNNKPKSMRQVSKPDVDAEIVEAAEEFNQAAEPPI